MIILIFLSNDSFEEKIKYAFMLADLDGNEELDMAELSSLIQLVCQSYMNLAKMPQSAFDCVTISQRCFHDMNTNNDKQIDFEEFAKWSYKDI